MNAGISKQCDYQITETSSHNLINSTNQTDAKQCKNSLILIKALVPAVIWIKNVLNVGIYNLINNLTDRNI